MSDQTVCRWGIISAATIGRKNWQAINLSGNGKVVAVASRSKEKAQTYIDDCQKLSAFDDTPRAVEGYEALLASDDIDAVYVPLPTGLRHKWVIKAAEAGKHVMCEKPCAISASQLTEMIDACAANNVQFMDGVMYMHQKRLDAIRTAIDTKIGDLRQITAQFSFCGDDSFKSQDIRTNSSLEPQGCLGDLGWYTIRFALWVMNYEMPVQVIGRYLNEHHRAESPEPVPMEVHAEFRFANGVHCTTYNSFRTGHQQFAHVSGTEGHVYVPDFVLPYKGDVAEFQTFTPEFVMEGCDFEMIPNSTTSSVKESGNSGSDSQETNLFRKFADLVLAGKVDDHWPMASLRTQKIMDAIQASALNGSQPITF